MDNKKMIGVAVAIVAIVLALAFLGKVKFSSPEPSPTPIPNQVENVPADQAPREFPAQLPIESGAKIISNYNATSPDGHLQATRVFLSSKSVQANFDLYKNWLTKNGWKILGQTDDQVKPDQKAIFAQDSSGILTVSIYQSTTGSTVDLSFLPVK